MYMYTYISHLPPSPRPMEQYCVIMTSTKWTSCMTLPPLLHILHVCREMKIHVYIGVHVHVWVGSTLLRPAHLHMHETEKVGEKCSSTGCMYHSTAQKQDHNSYMYMYRLSIWLYLYLHPRGPHSSCEVVWVMLQCTHYMPGSHYSTLPAILPLL